MNKKTYFWAVVLIVLIVGQFFYVKSLNSRIIDLEFQVDQLSEKELSIADYGDRFAKLERAVDDMDSNCTNRIDTLERHLFMMEQDMEDTKSTLYLQGFR